MYSFFSRKKSPPGEKDTIIETTMFTINFVPIDIWELSRIRTMKMEIRIYTTMKFNIEIHRDGIQHWGFDFQIPHWGADFQNQHSNYPMFFIIDSYIFQSIYVKFQGCKTLKKLEQDWGYAMHLDELEKQRSHVVWNQMLTLPEIWHTFDGQNPAPPGMVKTL